MNYESSLTYTSNFQVKTGFRRPWVLHEEIAEFLAKDLDIFNTNEVVETPRYQVLDFSDDATKITFRPFFPKKKVIALTAIPLIGALITPFVVPGNNNPLELLYGGAFAALIPLPTLAYKLPVPQYGVSILHEGSKNEGLERVTNIITRIGDEFPIVGGAKKALETIAIEGHANRS